MDKKSLGGLQEVDSTIASLLNRLWCLSSEADLKPTDYKAEELKTIDEALNATKELIELLNNLKEELKAEH